MTQQIEFGLDTFGDVTVGLDGTPVSHAQVIRDVVEPRACSPTRLGLDFFGVGEHHRADFAVSAPETVLAAHRRRAPSGSGSARPSRCSAPTIRSACSSASPRSTPSRTVAPR